MMLRYRQELDRLILDYNFPDRWYADVFVDLLEAVIRECDQPTVLDVGCGRGIFKNRRYQERLKPYIGRFIGVEPDRSVAVRTEIFDTVHADAIEEADIPEASVDIAYAAMVVEHVADPEPFLDAIARCLRPGGMLLVCTPNAATYFGWICSITKTLGLDEWLLRKAVGGDKVDGYHYPIAYRMNRVGDLRALAHRVGLQVQVGHTEAAIACYGYFPRLLRPLWSGFKLKRRIWRNPRALTHIVAVFEKLGSERCR